jgi:serine/threonine protein kinase
MAYHFFISYSTEDAGKAREIRALLDSLGANSWMAPDSIMPGDAYTVAIPKGIRDSAVLLLVFSRSSDQSEDVMSEVTLARKYKKRVVPVRIENTEPANLEYLLQLCQWVDMYNSQDREGEHRLRKLVAEVCGTPARAGGSGVSGGLLNPGDRVGDYEIVSLAGAGGMGRVYTARSVSSGRTDAIWVLMPHLAGDAELVEICRNGMAAQAALDHPNVAKVYSTLAVGGLPGMVMEHIEGASMETLLANRRIPMADIVNYAARVLDALGHVHARGVIHRNIKPRVILVARTGQVKLVGFSVACLHGASRHASGRWFGSPDYMSPEQIRSEELDCRSDLYSLGVTLYEMVTGRCPYTANSEFAVMQAHLQQTPEAPIDIVPDMPAALNAAILVAMSKTREARFQSAEAMRAALDGRQTAAFSF